jgi:ACR3 family arsenite efflux pump ArsB
MSVLFLYPAVGWWNPFSHLNDISTLLKVNKIVLLYETMYRVSVERITDIKRQSKLYAVQCSLLSESFRVESNNRREPR